MHTGSCSTLAQTSPSPMGSGVDKPVPCENPHLPPAFNLQQVRLGRLGRGCPPALVYSCPSQVKQVTAGLLPRSVLLQGPGSLLCPSPELTNTSEVSSLLFSVAGAGRWVQQVLRRGRDRQTDIVVHLHFSCHQPQMRLPPQGYRC